jgi:hypothetical protein
MIFLIGLGKDLRSLKDFVNLFQITIYKISYK